MSDQPGRANLAEHAAAVDRFGVALKRRKQRQIIGWIIFHIRILYQYVIARRFTDAALYRSPLPLIRHLSEALYAVLFKTACNAFGCIG